MKKPKKFGKIKKKKSAASDNDYVDNEALLAALKEYRALYEQTEAQKKPPPPVTPYIGESITKIATKLASRYNFVNYTYKDEMISEGVLNCIKYIKNFDPKKSKNPFCYISQICWHSFVRVIQNEKQQKFVAYKIAEQMNDPEYTKWFNETFSGLEDRFKECFGISEEDIVKIEEKLKKTRKNKK